MATNPTSPSDQGDPRTYLAAERTLLAWVRTGLALMGFGFVVARFGLFLRELASAHDAQNGATDPQPTASIWIGTTLVLVGVAVNIISAVRHARLIGRLRNGQPLDFRPTSFATLVALAMGLVGLAIAIYLILRVNQWS